MYMSKKPDQRISDKLTNGIPLFSVEFFPPKNEEGARQILRTALKVKEQIDPDFVSITYGAGGSTRERTQEYAELIRLIYNFDVMPHLTCVGHSRDELRHTLDRFYETGFRNIMTLRGDAPKGDATFKPHPDGFQYASELVEFIKTNYPQFCLGVAGYPENHPESKDTPFDIRWLKHKVDRGGDFITTQLFFNNADYYAFVKRTREAGITVPIVAGIMPVVSSSQLRRFCTMCGSTIPSELDALLYSAGESESAVIQVGIDWAYRQVVELVENGVSGIHLYLLNRSHSAIELIRKLRYNHIIG